MQLPFKLKSFKSGQKLCSIFEAGPQFEAMHMATIRRENMIAVASLAARAMNPSGEGRHCWQALTV